MLPGDGKMTCVMCRGEIRRKSDRLILAGRWMHWACYRAAGKAAERKAEDAKT